MSKWIAQHQFKVSKITREQTVYDSSNQKIREIWLEDEHGDVTMLSFHFSKEELK